MRSAGVMVIAEWFSYTPSRQLLTYGEWPFNDHESMASSYFVYMLTNRPRGVLYVGVTSDLVQRIWEHREAIVEGFTRDYNLKRLVHYEECSDVMEAIRREKRLKRWRRQWKIELVESFNPEWRDLYPQLCQL